MGQPLTDAGRAALVAGLTGWRVTGDGTAIERDFVFPDFGLAFAFMVRVALEAEKMDHHPDWSNSFNRVHIRLTSHDAGGLTDRDARLARAIDAIADDQRTTVL